MKSLALFSLIGLSSAFSLTAQAGFGDIVSNKCKITSVASQSRLADSIIPELAFSYPVAVTSFECQQPMVLGGGVKIQNFDAALNSTYTNWIQQLQNRIVPAQFVDLAYTAEVKSLAGQNLVSADAPRSFLRDHSLRVQLTESVYQDLMQVLDHQNAARVPFTAKSKLAPFTKSSWSRKTVIVSSDRTFGISIDDVGPTAGKKGNWYEPEISVSAGYVMTEAEAYDSAKSHALNTSDSKVIRSVFGDHFTIHDMTTGSKINDRDVTIDCRTSECQIAIHD